MLSHCNTTIPSHQPASLPNKGCIVGMWGAESFCRMGTARVAAFIRCGCHLESRMRACSVGGDAAGLQGQQLWARGKRTVAVLGGAGGIGQPLSLLLKLNPLVSDLRLYDVAGTPGVACDLSHVNTQATVEGYAGDAELEKTLKGCDLIIIPAGVPRKPGMTRDDLFNINAGIVKSLMIGIAKHAPKALVNIISNPVNSTVPIAAEVLKKAGVFDPRRLFGVTTLDVMRARTFYAARMKTPVKDVDLPVIGGHAGITILPLLSQVKPKKNMTEKDIDALTKRIQDGGTEVVQAKAGKGSATLSMAFAGALFAEACIKGLEGEKNVVECAYVKSDVVKGIPFFSSKVSYIFKQPFLFFTTLFL
uniref:Malate dehydrogenase n=1 Tax=Physcomitrium patens TaxID=3218 RepID=A0A2K1K808_PHYPA|nr:hypothetical protein PHYPA_011811 [Physcomitrium patens]